MRECLALSYQLIKGICHKAVHAFTAVRGRDYDTRAYRFELIHKEHLFPIVEAEYDRRLRIDQSGGQIKRRYADSSAYQQRSVSCVAPAVSVSEAGKHVKLMSVRQTCHLIGPVSQHLVNNGYGVTAQIADADRPAQKMPVQFDVDELARRRYAPHLALKLHKPCRGREPSVLNYSVDILFHTFFFLSYQAALYAILPPHTVR